LARRNHAVNRAAATESRLLAQFGQAMQSPEPYRAWEMAREVTLLKGPLAKREMCR
jgi:hypothetical protein